MVENVPVNYRIPSVPGSIHADNGVAHAMSIAVHDPAVNERGFYWA